MSGLITQMAEALTEAREYIAADLNDDLMCCCVLDDSGEPLRDTLNDYDRIAIEAMEQLLAKIDALLAPIEGGVG